MVMCVLIGCSIRSGHNRAGGFIALNHLRAPLPGQMHVNGVTTSRDEIRTT